MGHGKMMWLMETRESEPNEAGPGFVQARGNAGIRRRLREGGRLPNRVGAGVPGPRAAVAICRPT